MAGHDVLAVLPTGAGKSAIYQVPALLLEGPTVVVLPLIALRQANSSLRAPESSGDPDLQAAADTSTQHATSVATPPARITWT
jgi:ATP-dependent DNA helicase RecQ